MGGAKLGVTTRWLGLALCALLAVSYFATWQGWWVAPIGPASGHVALVQGRLLVVHCNDGAYRVPLSGNSPGKPDRIVWGFEGWRRSTSVGVNVPLWVCVPLLVAPTVWAWWRHARGVIRTRRGRCARCNYEVAGLSTSRCPECGLERLAIGRGGSG